MKRRELTGRVNGLNEKVDSPRVAAAHTAGDHTDFPSKHVPYIVPPVTFAPRLISATIGVKVSMSIGYPDAKRHFQ